MRITGRWHITESELWDSDALDLVTPAFIEFGKDGSGSFGFIAVRGEMDCREVERETPTPPRTPTTAATARHKRQHQRSSYSTYT